MATSKTVLDVLIVGGGLSGLLVGHSLHHQNTHGATTGITPARSKPSPSSLRWKLLEASHRLGGRLCNATTNNGAAMIDMGGAWIWPEHQPHLRALLRQKLPSIATFRQPDDPTSTRIVGGAVTLIEKLSEPLLSLSPPPGNQDDDNAKIELNSPVTRCRLLETEPVLVSGSFPHSPSSAPAGVVVQVQTARGDVYHARQVVFAVPPRLLSETVTFDPPLSRAKQEAMAQSRTWMAGVTKVALVYDTRFWDSRCGTNIRLGDGPAFQVYDSSTLDGTLYALTFFVHVPPNDTVAQQDDAALAQQVAQQLQTAWSRNHHHSLGHNPLVALSYTCHYVHRWPCEVYLDRDARPDRIHPHPVPNPALAQSEWDGRLVFAGTETDQHAPGVMEGAIGAAHRAVQEIDSFLCS